MTGEVQKNEGSVRVGLAVMGFIVVVGGGLFAAALLATMGLREGANGAALAFATEAALGRPPKDVPPSPGALAVLRSASPGGAAFETNVTATAGQFSNGVACVTVSRPGTASVRTVVVVTKGAGAVVSYGLADACPCPARLRPTSRLPCSP